MYKVSQDYIEALSEKVYDDRIGGRITFKDGTSMSVSDENLVKNSLKLTKELCGSEYRIGSFNLACLKMAVFDESALEKDYSNAVITLDYCLKFKNGGEQTVPLGIFIADGSITSRKRDKVYITAYDKGMYFDCEPSAEIREMTGTAPEIIEAVCEECGVDLGVITEGLPNSEVVVNLSDKQIQTCRDIVMWCSALICGYAVIDRDGLLNIISPKYSVSETDGTVINTARSIGPKERNSIHSTDTRAYIKYLTAYSAGNVKQYISDYTASDSQAAPASYAMTSNPLLTGKTEEECDEINKEWHKFIEMFKQRGVTARIFGDPAIDVGDSISFYGGDIDQRGNVIGIVTSYEWKYRNYHDIYCSAAECGEKISSKSGNSSSKVRNQTEKRIDAISSASKESSSAPSSALSAVTFEKNRLYYNGETYYLQFGFNKRIMCVTKGNKYALINSEGYTESRIEAATAVMNGLTEDWDLEFDYFARSGLSLDITRTVQGGSGVVKCSWGDGTVDSETSHSYSITAPVKVKIKLQSCSGITLHFNSIAWYNSNWAVEENPRYAEGYGAGIYIGGKFENVVVYCNAYAEYIAFGENVRKINEYEGSTFALPSKVKHRGHEHGIPPFVETIGTLAFNYSGSSYLYIPESCTEIKGNAFYCHSASEIEIESKGETLTLSGKCFRKPDASTGGNRIVKLNVPARVKATASGVFDGCGVGVIKFEKGCTEIDYNITYNADYSSSYFSDLNNAEPYFIFIPDTVTSIGNNLVFGSNYGRKVYIIYAGSQNEWEAITKAANWDGESGSNENVTVICNSELYDSYENVVRGYIKG